MKWISILNSTTTTTAIITTYANTNTNTNNFDNNNNNPEHHRLYSVLDWTQIMSFFQKHPMHHLFIQGEILDKFKRMCDLTGCDKRVFVKCCVINQTQPKSVKMTAICRLQTHIPQLKAHCNSYPLRIRTLWLAKGESCWEWCLLCQNVIMHGWLFQLEDSLLYLHWAYFSP